MKDLEMIEFLKPLHTHINDECARGSLRFVQEKFAKLCIRNCLANLSVTFRSAKDEGPKLLIGSLTSEFENLDTIMHIIVAQNIGWDVTYVGNGVPHDELIFMANKIKARAMVIALNHPRDIARKTHEIKENQKNQKELKATSKEFKGSRKNFRENKKIQFKRK